MTIRRQATLFTLFLSAPGFAATEADLRVSGFADLQYEWSQGPNVNTFRVGDGALYLTKSGEHAEAMIDIAFRSATSSGSGWEVAGPRSQAFVVWKPTGAWSLKGGQFDAIFGYEGNDGVDLLAVRQGPLFAMVPVVHLGVLSKYDWSEAINLSVLLSNPSDQGLMTRANPEVGVKLAYAAGAAKASLGALTNTNPGTGAPRNALVEILLGTELGPVAVDTDGVAKQEGLTTGARTQLGAGAIVNWKLRPDLNAFSRLEFLHGQAGSDPQRWSWTLGVLSKITPELSLKANYILEGRGGEPFHSLLAAGVYRF